jgi:hypothetical protein
MNTDQQFAAQVVLDYLSDMFTETPRETFSREEVLVVLNGVRTDTDLFDPAVVVAYELAMAEGEE